MKDKKEKSILQCLSSQWRHWFFFALLCVATASAYAQGKDVSGTVLDDHGESVIGASVVVKGTTNGVITDFDGKFALSNVPEDATLEISFVGYQTQSIPVAGKNNFQIMLEENAEALDEVVVVGYGAIQKRSVSTPYLR